MKLFLFLLFIYSQSFFALASESLSYSGRLVNANGAPVAGPVSLKFDLVYSNQPGVILCTQTLSGVDLINGVFHVTLDFSSCNLANVLVNTPDGQFVHIRVIDTTPDPDKIYSFQTINSVPFSFISQMSKQLVQMNAKNGQILTWSGGQWIPADPLPPGDKVNPITATEGLSGGTITDTGIVGIADNGITSAKIADNSIVDADVSTTAEIAQSKIKNLTTDLAAKESLISSGASTDYLNGIKSWTSFDQSVRNALLLGYTSGSATPVAATDNFMEAIGKLEGQIIANDTAFDNAGQWDKDGSLLFYTAGNVGIGTATPSEKLDVVGNIALSGKIRLKDSGLNYVELKSPTTIPGTVTFTLPGTLGTNGQVLVTDALGNLSWSTPSTSSSQIVDGSIVDADVSGSANIAQSKIANLTTDLAAKEPTLIAGATTQYLRGDKSWQTLNSDAVVEGTKLYFTEPRVLGTDLAGLSIVAGTVTDADSVLSALGKLIGNQSNYVLKAGDSMIGNLLMGGNFVTGLGTPLLDSDAATKLYVDTEVNNKAYWTKTVNDLSYSTGNVGVGTATPANKLDVIGDVALSGKLRLKSDTANYIELKAPLSLGSTQTYIFPATTGTSGYALTTNGTGILAWSAVATTSTSVGGDLSGTIASTEIVSGAVGSAEIADLSIVNADIANTTIAYGKLNLIDGDIPQAKVNGLVTALIGKEPTITAGTAAQYWRGDKSWQTLNTTAVPEGTNLYFLDSRVRGALLSGYAAGSAIPLAATDTLLEALAKLEGQIIANKAAFDSTGQWSKNGTNVYYNEGNVGIGTTNPISAKLHLQSSPYGGTPADANNRLKIESSGHSYIGLYSPNTFDQGIHFGDPESEQVGRITYRHSTDMMQFRTNAAERMVIDSVGNVGIGTSSPNARLAVTSSVAASNANFRVDNGSKFIGFFETGAGSYNPATMGSQAIVFSNDNDPLVSTGGLSIVPWSDAAGGIHITESGSVGIGTSAPTAKLDISSATTNVVARIGSVAAATSAQLNINSAASGYPHILFTQGGVGRFEIGQVASNGNFYFNNNTQAGEASAAMVIAKNGSVGIGTSTPRERLDLGGNGRAVFGPNSTWGANLIVGGNGWSGPDATVAATNGNLHLESRVGAYSTYINWYGATAGLRVGNGTSGGFGPVQASAFTVSSDVRLKKGITKLTNATSNISKMRGVTYKYKDERYNQEQQIGVIAQEVQKVYPEAVLTDEEGMLSVNYASLVAPLIEAVKEQQETIVKNIEMLKIMNGSIQAHDESIKNNGRRIASLEAHNLRLGEQLKELQEENLKLKSRLERIERLLAK